MKNTIQSNFWIGGQRIPNETPMQKRSPSGARAQPERSTELRKEHGTPKGRSKAGAEPERSPSGARTEKGLRKERRTPKGRSGSRNYTIPRPQNLPAFLEGSMLLELIRLKWVCLFPDMPCMKRVYQDKNVSAHWSPARNKERFSSRR